MNEVKLPDGGRLAIAVQGSGRSRPLLLVRPLGGSLVSWGAFAELLAAEARVITFDARGSGCSSAAPFAMTTRRMAGDALAVLDALAVERADVFGLSLGGMVASWLAVDAAARLDRLVLASTPVRGANVHTGGWRRGLAMARCLMQLPRAAEACLATHVLSDEFRSAHRGEVARIRARARARPASHLGLLALLAAAGLHDIAAHLRDVRAETLVVAGGRDALLPSGVQERLAARLPDARFAVVPESGHDVAAEVPAVLAGLVLAHLRRPRRPAP
jgi:pimeloyl-ACP methyl ester carboxylesterase